jgi:hypothetical protein
MGDCTALLALSSAFRAQGMLRGAGKMDAGTMPESTIDVSILPKMARNGKRVFRILPHSP